MIIGLPTTALSRLAACAAANFVALLSLAAYRDKAAADKQL